MAVSRPWRRSMRSKITSTGSNRRPSMLCRRASMRCRRRSRAARRGGSSAWWCTPCNIATRRCRCTGAMPSCASPVRASPGWERSTRCTTRERAIFVVGPDAAIRISRRAASFRSVSCGGVQGSRAGSDLRTRCPVTTKACQLILGANSQAFQRPRVHRRLESPGWTRAGPAQRRAGAASTATSITPDLRTTGPARTWNNSRSRSRTSSSDRCRRGPTSAMACSSRVRLRW